MLRFLLKDSLYLLVVAIVEAAVGDAEEGARLGVVSVLAVALQKREGGDEVALLQKVVRVWQAHLFLLHMVGIGEQTEQGVGRKLTCLACTLGAIALLRLMAETGRAIILTDLNLNL